MKDTGTMLKALDQVSSNVAEAAAAANAGDDLAFNAAVAKAHDTLKVLRDFADVQAKASELETTIAEVVATVEAATAAAGAVK